MNEVQPIRRKKDIEAMKKALGNPRDKLLFIFGINTGFRISDILGLKIGDIIANGKPIDALKVKEKKTGKTRVVKLNKSIKDELAKIEGDADEYLFKSRKGNKPISRVQAYRILNAGAVRARIKDEIGTHTLRKTFGYHAYKKGVPVPLLMDILNHSSEKITLRYIGIKQESFNDVYDAINL